MLEENKVSDVKVEDKAPPVEKELSAFEQKMMNHGWKPDGELSAEDWIDNGFKVKNKKLDSLFQSVETLKEKLIRQERDAYAKAKADLEAQRIEAIEEADVKRVKQIEQQANQLTDPSVMEHLNAFKERNKAWMDGISYRDLEMQSIVRQKDQELANRALPADKHFEALENYMKGKFPDYFNSDPAPISNAVEGKQATVAKQPNKSKLTFEDLDEFQKKAARNLKESTGMSYDDYIKQVIEMDKQR